MRLQQRSSSAHFVVVIILLRPQNDDFSATPIRRDSCTRPRAEGFTGDTLVTAADGALKYSKDTQADDEFCVCRQDVGGCIGGEEEEEEEEERLKPATKAASAAVET